MTAHAPASTFRTDLPDPASPGVGLNDMVREPRSLNPLSDMLAYQRDVCERSILFLDTLRQRADDMLAHERAGMPPLLDFDYELILDARRFKEPANYALLRIMRVGDDCLDDCLDPAKPPVIIVDPRAGHGPGIGGFKHESEVGVALHEGHAVYLWCSFPNLARDKRSRTSCMPCAALSKRWAAAIPDHHRFSMGIAKLAGR